MTLLLWIMHNYLTIASVYFVCEYVDRLQKLSLSGWAEAFKDTFLITVVPIVGITIDPELTRKYLILCIPMLLGIVARFGSLYKKRLLNKRNLITQLLVTVPFCVFAYWGWVYSGSKFPIELIIAGVSYFSITIVSIEAETGELTVRAWLYKLTGGIADVLKPKNND